MKRAKAVGIANGQFPKLKVELYRGDRLVKVEEFDDPREEFVRFFNEQQERIEAAIEQATKAATKQAIKTGESSQTLTR